MIRTLGWLAAPITEAGHDAESGAVVFATTPYFLERMGLRSLDELPELAPHLPEVAELENELRQFATPGPEPMDMSPQPVERQAAGFDELYWRVRR